MGPTNSRNEIVSDLRRKVDKGTASLRHYENILEKVQAYTSAGPDAFDVRDDVASMIRIRMERVRVAVANAQRQLDDFLVRA